MQSNLITGKAYKGKNQAILSIAKTQNKFKSNQWLTFNQARQSNRQILKGSKSVSIFKGYGRGEKEDENGKIKTFSYSNGWANVFNLDQTKEI